MLCALGSDRLTKALAFIAGALLVGACTSLWGIDDLEYDRVGESGLTTTSGGSGGAPTSTTTSSSSQGGTFTTTSVITSSGGCGFSCESCLLPDCANANCADQVGSCEAESACSSLRSCMQACAPDDSVCQTPCIAAAPLSASLYFQALDCAGCGTNECLDVCSGACTQGCGGPAESCSECINGPCAEQACNELMQACSQSSACLGVSACIVACGSDTACKHACANGDPDGAVIYNAVIQCAVCTRPACWDVCSAAGASCQGFGDGG